MSFLGDADWVRKNSKAANTWVPPHERHHSTGQPHRFPRQADRYTVSYGPTLVPYPYDAAALVSHCKNGHLYHNEWKHSLKYQDTNGLKLDHRKVLGKMEKKSHIESTDPSRGGDEITLTQAVPPSVLLSLYRAK